MMNNTLVLNVEVMLGSNLDSAVKDGCALAAKLGLGCITFEANGQHFCCYANWTARKWATDPGSIGIWSWESKAWDLPPHPIIWDYHPLIRAGGREGK